MESIAKTFYNTLFGGATPTPTSQEQAAKHLYDGTQLQTILQNIYNLSLIDEISTDTLQYIILCILGKNTKKNNKEIEYSKIITDIFL